MTSSDVTGLIEILLNAAIIAAIFGFQLRRGRSAFRKLALAYFAVVIALILLLIPSHYAFLFGAFAGLAFLLLLIVLDFFRR